LQKSLISIKKYEYLQGILIYFEFKLYFITLILLKLGPSLVL